MPVRGLHHITAITAEAPVNVDFYARVLGLRMIKKTVNFDAPDVYHLYYGGEGASPGTVLTFFEFPGMPNGRAGAGMVHRIDWRLADGSAQEFWERRLAELDVGTRRADGAVVFSDPEGLEHGLVVDSAAAPELAARAVDVPPEHALRGFAGVRAFSAAPQASAAILTDALGLDSEQAAPDQGAPHQIWRTPGQQRAAIAYDPPPVAPGAQGAGSVHHIAWAVDDDQHLRSVRERVGRARARPTEVIDRQYFHSVYFREPSGVLFELATAGPGFAVDEPAERLGERLSLPPQYEPLREHLLQTLTPLVNPRSAPASD